MLACPRQPISHTVAMRQLSLFKPRGGARRGAGRPPKGVRAGSAHKTRPELSRHHPVHVVLRVVGAIGNLRRNAAYAAIRDATLTAAPRENFRIVHLSIQRTHLHLLVEADHRMALARGMQSFQISAAKHLNRELSKPGPRRRGTVFPDRYHATILTSPRQVRHALAYVLGNWRRHGEHLARRCRHWTVDWYSTAPLFPAWTELSGDPCYPAFPPSYDPLIVYRPRTWLLRVGWQRHGPTLSYAETPAAPP
jgi:putative transposase